MTSGFCKWKEMGVVCLGCFSEQVRQSLGKSDLAQGLTKTPWEGSFSSSCSNYSWVMWQGWLTMLSPKTCYEKLQTMSHTAVCVCTRACACGSVDPWHIRSSQCSLRYTASEEISQKPETEHELWLHSTELFYILKLCWLKRKLSGPSNTLQM